MPPPACLRGCCPCLQYTDALKQAEKAHDLMICECPCLRQALWGQHSPLSALPTCPCTTWLRAAGTHPPPRTLPPLQHTLGRTVQMPPSMASGRHMGCIGGGIRGCMEWHSAGMGAVAAYTSLPIRRPGACFDAVRCPHPVALPHLPSGLTSPPACLPFPCSLGISLIGGFCSSWHALQGWRVWVLLSGLCVIGSSCLTAVELAARYSVLAPPSPSRLPYLCARFASQWRRGRDGGGAGQRLPACPACSQLLWLPAPLPHSHLQSPAVTWTALRSCWSWVALVRRPIWKTFGTGCRWGAGLHSRVEEGPAGEAQLQGGSCALVGDENRAGECAAAEESVRGMPEGSAGQPLLHPPPHPHFHHCCPPFLQEMEAAGQETAVGVSFIRVSCRRCCVLLYFDFAMLLRPPVRICYQPCRCIVASWPTAAHPPPPPQLLQDMALHTKKLMVALAECNFYGARVVSLGSSGAAPGVASC